MLLIAGNILAASSLQAMGALEIEVKAEVRSRLDEYTSYAMGSILLAATSVEASANELIFRCGEPYDTFRLSAEQKDICRKIAHLEALDGFDRLKVLSKFDVAILMSGNQCMDKGRSPYQDAEALIMLRNKLVHYAPEWNDSSKEQKLEKLLKGRFEELPNAKAFDLPFFPGRCLTYSAARWANRTAYKYIHNAYSLTQCGLVPKNFQDPDARLPQIEVAIQQYERPTNVHPG